MDADLEPIYFKITQATRPEAVFGALDGTFPPDVLREHVQRSYQELKQITAPESGYSSVEDDEEARAADDELERFRADAEALIAQGLYGIDGYDRPRPSHSKAFRVGANTYYRGPKLASGGRTTVYDGLLQRNGQSVGGVIIKVVADAEDNGFIENEIRILDILHKVNVPQWRHLPLVLDKFTAGARAGIVLRKIAGYDLEQVRKDAHHREGVDQKHMVWMLDRLLSCLGYVHSQGIVHGTLGPSHILIRPSNHNAFIVGWSSAVHNPAVSQQAIQAEPPNEFLAPEVLERKEIGPWSDIYSLGKTMIWLLGGDPHTDEMPSHVSPPIQELLRRMVADYFRARPSDAWQLYDEQNELKDSLWQRKFLRFNMTRP